jgi:hypothetical protein
MNIKLSTTIFRSAIWGITFLIALPTPYARSEINFKKIFYADQVNPDSRIWGGGQVQTWASKEKFLTKDKVTIVQNPLIEKEYEHCQDNTARKIIEEGLPIKNLGVFASGGWNPPQISVEDNHQLPNVATLKIGVGPIVEGPTPINVVGMAAPVMLKNSVKVDIEGFVNAGTIQDGDKCHSADSFGAVQLEAKNSYIFDGSVQKYQALQKNAFIGGYLSVLRPDGQRVDATGVYVEPYFLEVTDLNTNISTSQIIMKQSLEYHDALFTIDDTGIRLTINRNNPNAFVSLDFTNEFPWVLNPYTYGARLDKNGLFAFGKTPQSNWQITTTDELIEAFFPYGVEGKPFDYSDVLPPESLFSIGNTYQYDVGNDAGAYEIKTLQQVPEPTSSLSLLALGTIGAASTLKRKLKPSKSAEKETTKVG